MAVVVLITCIILAVSIVIIIQVSFLKGRHNAFPRRLPSAGSEKLRQMYLNTDTISGRLVLNSAQEQSRQKRLRILQTAILEQQAYELEERNKQVNLMPSASSAEVSVRS